MAQNASDSQKVDYLWKKIVYGAAKTDISGNIDATNEPVASPLLIRGDKILQQSDLIPGVIPGSNSSVVTVYPTTFPAECTSTSGIPTPTLTWQTGRTFWVPPEFGSTYQIKVYIAPSGNAANVASKGTQVFATGSGFNDLWVFDYQSGVLNFNSNNTPNASGAPISFTGNSVYISGGVYSGAFGLPTVSSGGSVGNLTISNVTISANSSAVSSSANIIFSTSGTGAVQFTGNNAIGLPIGNIANRPTTVNPGYLRFNTEYETIEVWDGTEWVQTSGGVVTSDVLNGDGSTTQFALSANTTTTGVLVSINGTIQKPSTAYTVSNNVITFTEIPALGDAIEVRKLSGGTISVNYGNADVAAFLSTYSGLYSNVQTATYLSTNSQTIGGNLRVNGNIRLLNGATINDTPNNSLAIGYSAGLVSQGVNALAIGINAGIDTQGDSTVAIGYNAGYGFQGEFGVAVGTDAGNDTQGINSVAIGYSAGRDAQGINAVAIGYSAGQTSQANNSIIINATGSALNMTTANTFVVAPVRNDPGNISTAMYYNTSTKEITYANTSSSYSNVQTLTYLTSGVAGNIIPSANVTYSLGSPTRQWKDLFVSNTTIYLGGIPLSIDASGNLLVNGSLVQGSGGSGSGTSYSNVNVAAYLSTNNYLTSTTANLSNYAYAANITTANLGMKGYVDSQSFYSNAKVSTYLPTYSGNVSALNFVGAIQAQVGSSFAYATDAFGSLYDSGSVFLTADTNSNAIVAGYTIVGNSGAVTLTVTSATVIEGSPNFVQVATTPTASNFAYPVTVYTANYSPALPLSTITVGNATVSGNVSAQYFVGNGALLTGISTGSNYGNTQVEVFANLRNYAWNANVTSANVGMKGYVDGANLAMKGYVDSVATLSSYSNVNVSALITTNGLTNYSNVNAKAYAESMGYQNFGNVNVTAYVTSMGVTNYSNVNLIAYLAGNITTGNITATGFIGNGAGLTNVTFSQAGNIVGTQTNVTLQAGTFTSVFDNQGNVILPNVYVSGGATVVGTVNSNGGTAGTAFAVRGSGAVSNVALGYFPPIGTAAEMAIRDYSTANSAMYFDNTIGSGNVGGTFQFRSTSSYTQWAKIDRFGITLPTRPAFRVNGSAGPSQTTANVSLKSPQTVVIFNQGSYYNDTTGQFVAPVAGLYAVGLNARVSTNTSSQIAVLKNGLNSSGNIVCFWETIGNSGTATHYGVNGTVVLAVGDYLSANILLGTVTFDGNDNWHVTYIG